MEIRLCKPNECMEENMSLVEDSMQPCTLLEKHRVTDGRGASFDAVWEDGISFMAMISYDQTTTAKVAQAQGAKDIITVTTKNLELDYHDAFRRDEDGQVFRVISKPENSKAPKVASPLMASLRSVNAEEWKLP